MDFDNLMRITMEQALKKGFGTKKEEIIVSEKISLIHSEISEAYDAYLLGNMEGKHGFYEEMGDAMQRVLHLAGVFQMNLSVDSGKDESEIISKAPLDGKIARLHKIISESWENYRKNEVQKFQGNIICLIRALNQVSLDFDFDLEGAIKKKITNNTDRDWKGRGLNERFVGA